MRALPLMTQSTRHRWQARWHLAEGPPRAVHDSGLTVHLAAGPGGIAGSIDPAQPAVTELAAKHGLHNLPQMLERLRREAEAVAQAAAKGLPARCARLDGPPSPLGSSRLAARRHPL